MDRTDAIALVAANARIDELLVSNNTYQEEARAARWTLIEREATLRTIEHEWSIQRQSRHTREDELKGALARSEAALEEARREVSLLNQQAVDLTKRWEEGRRAATPPAGPTYERPVVDLVNVLRQIEGALRNAVKPTGGSVVLHKQDAQRIITALDGIDDARYGVSPTAAETMALSETGQPLHVVESWRETVTSLQRRLTEVTADRDSYRTSIKDRIAERDYVEKQLREVSAERDKAVAERDTADSRYIRLEMGRPVGLTFAELTRESVARCDEAFAQPSDTTHAATSFTVENTPRGLVVSHISHLMSWSALEWAAALAGEVGELCNLLKKLRRRGPNATPTPEERSAIGKELADCQCYLPLVAARLGLDLAAETIGKFNEVSERVNSPRRLGLPVTDHAHNTGAKP